MVEKMKRYVSKIKPIKGVSIDIGGPLRVSDIEMNAAHKNAFGKRGIPYNLEDREAWQLYGIFSAKGYEGFMRIALALTRANKHLRDFSEEEDIRRALENLIEQYISEKDEIIISEMAKDSELTYNTNPSKRIQPDARNALKLLKDNNIPMTIVTSSFTGSSIKWVEELFPGYFTPDAILGKDTPIPEEQDPKTGKLILAAERMSLNPQEMLYIADTLGDIENSRKAGCQVGMVLNGMGFPDLWRHDLPDYEFENLEEAAKFIVDLKGEIENV